MNFSLKDKHYHNMKKNLLLFVAALSALVSCQQEQELLPQSSNVIDFRADIGHYYVKATDTSFENGDAVSIAALSPINSGNVKYTVRNGILSSDTPICWLDGQTEKTEFILVYPYQDSLSVSGDFHLAFSVNADQSTHALYTASDLMIGDEYGVAPFSSVTFNVQHALSQVSISIDNKSDKTIKEVFLAGVYGRAEMTSSGIRAIGSLGTVKACPVSGGSSQNYVMIIPPQTSKPELIITTTDGKQITYTLPSEVKFNIGAKSTAKVVLNKESVVTSFTTVISDWTPDNELNFSNGGPQPQTDSLDFLGTGKLLEGFVASLFGFPREEFEVDYYTDADGNLVILDPYKNWPGVEMYGFSLVPGARITLSDNGKGEYYIKNGSSTGLYEDYYGEFKLSSYCEENIQGAGYDTNDYFQFYYEGCLYCPDGYYIFETERKTFSTSVLNTIFTLPGYIRPVEPEISRMEYDAKLGQLSLRTPLDLTRFGVAVTPYSQALTQELVDSVIAGTASGMLFYNDAIKGETDITLTPQFGKTGAYRVLAVADGVYVDNNRYWQYRYLNIPYVAPGDVAPSCEIRIDACEVNKYAPTSMDLIIVGKDLSSIQVVPVHKRDFDAWDAATQEDILAHISDGDGVTYSGNSIVNGKKIILSGLVPNDKYMFVVIGQNLFGNKTVVKQCEYTGAENKFVSIGTGKFYDNFIPVNFFVSEKEYVTKVEILQESTGKPIYRVMNPYAKLMQERPELYGGINYNDKPSQYIEFYVHSYPSGNFVFYQPFSIGLSYTIDAPYELSYYHESGDVYTNPENYYATYCNRQIAEGVFSFAPTVQIGGTNYIFDLNGDLGALVVALPGYDWDPDAPVSETKSSVPSHPRARIYEPVSKDDSASRKIRRD